MTLTSLPPVANRALREALDDELETTRRTYPAAIAARPLAPRVEFGAQLRGVRDVLELRSAFALARRRSPELPPTPAQLGDAFRDVRVRVVPRPAAAPLPPTPRFVAAAAWCAEDPAREALVDRELAQLTQDWPPSLASDRERLRRIAQLLVFNRRATPNARSA